MHTCCPNCRTRFRISAAHLSVAQGRVRCGECRAVFDAREHLEGAVQPAAVARHPAVSAFDAGLNRLSQLGGGTAHALAMQSEHTFLQDEERAVSDAEPETEEPSEEAEQRLVPDRGEGEDEDAEQVDGHPAFAGSGDAGAWHADEAGRVAAFEDSGPDDEQASVAAAEGVEDWPEPEASEAEAVEEGAARRLAPEFRAGWEETGEDTGLDTADDWSGTEPPAEEAAGMNETRVRDEDLRALLDPSVATTHGASAGVPWWGTAGWVAGVIALLVLLVAQYGYFNRNELAAYPGLRPWVQSLCAVTGCSIPPQRDLSRIELVSRNVVSHPSVPNALLVSATLVNHAPFPQPYPVLEVKLLDVNGKVVAMRRFRPSEYLSEGLFPELGMVPEMPVRVVLEVEDPSNSATSFQFEFL